MRADLLHPGNELPATGLSHTRAAIVALACLACAVTGAAAHLRAQAAHATGKLQVAFLYMPPTSIEPTYHTAIWLEDARGQLVKTLYVSHELSSTEYKVGEACPDWVKQAHWEKAAPSAVDAVTGPTPNVGPGSLEFAVDRLALAPGRYTFCFQVHITDKYNVLYRGPITLGQGANEAPIEVLYSPSKPAGGTDYVRDVTARYVPAGSK